MGITSNGGLAALPKESLALAAEAELGGVSGTLGTLVGDGNTCPCTRTWAEGDEEDVPNLMDLPRTDGSFRGSPETSALHFETSWTTSPPKLEALP